MNNFFSKGLNKFNISSYSPLIIFSPEYNELRKKIKSDVNSLLFQDNLDYFEKIEETAHKYLLSDTNLTIDEIELLVEKDLFFNHKADSFVFSELVDRCNRVASQIIYALHVNDISFSDNSKILDVGAGSGLITKIVKDNIGIDNGLLTDVVDYRYDEVIKDSSLKFQFFNYPFEKIETDEKFDLLIITNTLHHCDDPFKVFKTALRYMNTGGVIAVVESCVSIKEKTLKINKKDSSLSYKMPFQNVYDTDTVLNDFTKTYLQFSKNEMMIYGSFFDWLYNRVFLNENVNVPYNFGAPEAWDSFFENCGLKKIKTFMLGFDQPTALEFHTLHLFKK